MWQKLCYLRHHKWLLRSECCKKRTRSFVTRLATVVKAQEDCHGAKAISSPLTLKKCMTRMARTRMGISTKKETVFLRLTKGQIQHSRPYQALRLASMLLTVHML